MKRNRFTVEAIIRMLRETDVSPSREEHRSNEPGVGDCRADLISQEDFSS